MPTARAVHARLRIYVGANQPQMMRMASRIADHIMVGDPTPGRFANSMRMLDDLLHDAESNRNDITVSGLVAWHIKSDRTESMFEARSQLALPKRGVLAGH